MSQLLLYMSVALRVVDSGELAADIVVDHQPSELVVKRFGGVVTAKAIRLPVGISGHQNSAEPECDGGRARVRPKYRQVYVGGVVDDHQAVPCAACRCRQRSCEVGVQALRPFLSTARNGLRDGFVDLLPPRAPVAIS